MTLKLPFQNRKHWTGVLHPADDAGDAWRLEITENKNTLALDFRFDEVREMRLVPVVDFKGRRRNPDGKNAAPAADAALNGEQDR